MARYSEEIIEQVRQNNDVVDVISQYVHLTRKGRNYFGLCPFHNEKSPSFSVSPDRQIFHCFGCGVGGNVYSFLMKIEGIGFKEAVEQLAEKANIQLPTIENEKMYLEIGQGSDGDYNGGDSKKYCSEDNGKTWTEM